MLFLDPVKKVTAQHNVKHKKFLKNSINMQGRQQITYFSIRGFTRKDFKPGFKIRQLILCMLCNQKINEHKSINAVKTISNNNSNPYVSTTDNFPLSSKNQRY